MKLNWLQSAMMGLISGLSELLPLSAEANRGLLRLFFGTQTEGPLFSLLCHIAVLAALLAFGQLDLGRLRRTGKLLKTPPKRRTSHPDLNSTGTLKLLRPAGLLAVVGRLLSVHFAAVSDKLYLLIPMLILSGVLLWLPNHFRTANKDGRHLAPADGMLMGLGAALSALPGISPVGASASLGILRGTDQRYAVRFSWLLLVLSLAAAIVIDLLTLAGTGFTFGWMELLCAGIGAVCAAAGAYLALKLMLGLVRRGGIGISGFCY